jgi:transcriptional regulator with XRE-family HTH domain
MGVMNVELLKLGLRIRASRKMLGWSQKDFSRQCGLDRSYFGGVERGERNLTFSCLCEICTGLDCDIAAVTKGKAFAHCLETYFGPEYGRLRSDFCRLQYGIHALCPDARGIPKGNFNASRKV